MNSAHDHEAIILRARVQDKNLTGS